MDIDINNVSPEQLQMLARMPIGPPPPGVVPNFVNPPTRAALQIWPTSIFMGIALIFFFNRLYIKACLMKKWSWDDLTLLLSMILGCGQYVTLTIGVTKGILGRHLWDISVIQFLTNPVMPRISYAILVLCPWNLLFLKLTFFLLFLQLFGRVRWIKITCWVGIAFTFMSNATIAMTTMAMTNPHEYQSWRDYAILVSIPLAILNLVTDVVIFVIPFAAIIPLQMSNAKRIGALGVFLTGGSAIVCSIFNIYYRCMLRTSTDNTWDGVLSSVFSTSEVMIAIVCACVPSAVYGFRQEGSIYQRVFRVGRYSNMHKTTPTPTPVMGDSASAHSRSEIYSKSQSTTICTRTSSDRRTIEVLYPSEELEMKEMDESLEEECKVHTPATPEPAHFAEPKDVNMMV